jgi:hypothetical protein
MGWTNDERMMSDTFCIFVEYICYRTMQLLQFHTSFTEPYIVSQVFTDRVLEYLTDFRLFSKCLTKFWLLSLNFSYNLSDSNSESHKFLVIEF